MKIGNYTPDELRDANLMDLQRKKVPQETINRLKNMYAFPDKIVEFLTEVRKIKKEIFHDMAFSCNVPALHDRYFLVCKKTIGIGKMSKIYLFYDRNTNQYVVFKLVPFQQIRNAARLQREKGILTALNKLDCPHLVKVLGLGIDNFCFLYANPSDYIIDINAISPDTNPQNINVEELLYYDQEVDTMNPDNIHIFLVMPYIQGQTLESYCLARGSQYAYYSQGNNLFGLLKTILEVIYKITEVLEQIHQLGLVHRDIKPHNIIMPKENPPVLIDFGIAQRQDIEGEQQAYCTTTPGLGTPGYRDPCTLQYEAAMKTLQDKITTIIQDNAMDWTHWENIMQELQKICASYPLQTQRLNKQIHQQQNSSYHRWFRPRQETNIQSMTIQQWNELAILVAELQCCSHPYEDVFSLGATLYWCLTGNTFTNTSNSQSEIAMYLCSPVAVEIRFIPSLFGVDSQVNAAQKNNELQTLLNNIELALNTLLTKMLQHPLEKRCSLKEVQRELDKIIKMLPKK